MLHGLGPDDLRYFIYKPKHLADPVQDAETYGETSWYPPAICGYAVGRYDREPSNIFMLRPQEEATRMVTLMGGRTKVAAAAAVDTVVAFAFPDRIVALDVRRGIAEYIRTPRSISASWTLPWRWTAARTPFWWSSGPAAAGAAKSFAAAIGQGEPGGATTARQGHGPPMIWSDTERLASPGIRPQRR